MARLRLRLRLYRKLRTEVESIVAKAEKAENEEDKREDEEKLRRSGVQRSKSEGERRKQR